jgi:hypothetical protein
MAGWQEAECDGPSAATQGPWTAATNPALRSFLDHIAEELAREYVRLMERAADPVGADHDNQEH